MKKKVLVLGAGLIGKPLAIDLSKDTSFDVSIADISGQALSTLGSHKIATIKTDLSDKKQLSQLVSDYDLIVNAVPGFMGFNTLKTIIEAGKSCADIAFYPEDALSLVNLAKEKEVQIISDIGVAPGMSNLLAGYAASKLDETDQIDIFVGGLPKVRTLPWEYKAVFSPTDVIEEYTRPARLMENGQIVTKDPLTEIELLHFDKPGTLEAFNSDGLRSLLFTIKAKNMREKTLRYPGYAAKIQFLADNGFFDTNPVNNKGMSPLELTSQLLFKQWKLNEKEEDLTVMRIVVEGKKDGKNLRYSFDLYDEYDPNTETHSMARTTAYTASMAVRLIQSGMVEEKGLFVPEQLGNRDDVVDFMLAGLAERNVLYKKEIISL
ncbi:MAG: saccharopine dehydrogenase NADP-binding domain-containing protein [Bacteroidales bacterium]|nr:saccharopine dehydrogenase NADP-binding domain-containing protein [Bacteroidales bacterium]